jgi:hypothetical protein
MSHHCLHKVMRAMTATASKVTNQARTRWSIQASLAVDEKVGGKSFIVAGRYNIVG